MAQIKDLKQIRLQETLIAVALWMEEAEKEAKEEELFSILVLPKFLNRSKSSPKPVHGVGRRFGDHGSLCPARVKKIGKNKARVVKPSRVTNYIY